MLPIPSTDNLIIESVTRVWDGRFPLDTVSFRQRKFDTTFSALRTWELWRRGAAAALLPYDPISDQVVLIEQFRLPAHAASLNPIMTEVPAGLCEPGENPLDTIIRECREEARLEVLTALPIGDFLLSAGGSDEHVTLFVGHVKAPLADPTGIVGHAGLATEDEDIRIRVWAATDAIDAALDGKMPNSVTAIALLWLAARRDRLRQTWRTP